MQTFTNNATVKSEKNKPLLRQSESRNITKNAFHRLQEPEFQPGVWFNLLRQKLAASFAKGLPFRDRGSSLKMLPAERKICQKFRVKIYFQRIFQAKA